MKYMGSKNRISKYILPIMLSERRCDQWWVEPFVGGANIIDKVTGNRLGGDSNKYLVALLGELKTQVPFNPPFVGETEYKKIQKNMGGYPDWLVGYVGFGLSFGAKFFGGYRRDKLGIRNYENEAQQNFRAQQENLKGVIFWNTDYRSLYIPKNSLIYCDPPYRNTTRYRGGFNHDIFWAWCFDRKLEGHTVFVSEYTGPTWAKIVWSRDVPSDLTVNRYGRTRKEYLFKL